MLQASVREEGGRGTASGYSTHLVTARTRPEAFICEVELFNAQWTGLLLIVVDELILRGPRHLVIAASRVAEESKMIGVAVETRA